MVSLIVHPMKMSKSGQKYGKMAKDFTKWPNGQTPVASGQIKKLAKNEHIWPQEANNGNPGVYEKQIGCYFLL